MKLAEFISLLKDHDWFYYNADDQRAWGKGKKEELIILDAAKKDPNLATLLDNYRAYVFNREKDLDE